jgi:PAS domain S-box-containing protein
MHTSDPAVQQQLRAAIVRASQGETVRFEARIHPRTDLDLDILMTITSHRDARQQVEYLICAGRDITERKHAEDELRTLVDAIPYFICMMHPDGSAEYHNQQLCDYTNMTPEQLQGNGWIQCLHPDDRRCVFDAWQTAVRTKTPYEVEQRIQHGSTGDYHWFLARAIPLRDHQGTIQQWFGTCTDIDDQKRVEQQLKASEENWRVLAETVPQLVWTARPDGSLTYCNHQWYDYIGSSPEQSLGEGWSQFLHPDDYQHTLTVWRHALETGEPFEIEYRFKDGTTGGYRWFLGRAMPVRDDTGQIVKWFGTSTDIDEKKQAEDEIRVLVDAIPQFVWIMRPDGSSDYSNRRWCDYTTMTPEQAQGDGWLQAIHPDDQQRAQEAWQRAAQTGMPYETEQRMRNGTTGDYRWFLARGEPFKDAQGTILKYVGTSTDIDEQKQAEERIKASEQNWRVLAETMPQQVWTTSPDGRVD